MMNSSPDQKLVEPVSQELLQDMRLLDPDRWSYKEEHSAPWKHLKNVCDLIINYKLIKVFT